ncbi:Crp/Fnr family transcriptional regulator [Novosphingobium colocasiae]|uniref:Crp/Fnr family transcriptional regulator n=1 Tax=Novosphingobium colocasiae TaxID=1256513 RepID=UPI0035B4072D
MSGIEKLSALLPAELSAALAPHARLVQLRAGQTLIGHQDDTDDVFIVLDGTLRVELVSRNGREIILSDAGVGAIVGEFAALDGAPRSASVTTVGKATVARVPARQFREAALATPESAGWLALRLVRMVRTMTERVFELNALAVRSRLHCELLRMALDAGIDDNAATLAPSPTHAELANRIGTHREAVTRELGYLTEQGITRSAGRTLSILDVGRLAEVVRAAAGDVELIQRAREARLGRA